MSVAQAVADWSPMFWWKEMHYIEITQDYHGTIEWRFLSNGIIAISNTNEIGLPLVKRARFVSLCMFLHVL